MFERAFGWEGWLVAAAFAAAGFAVATIVGLAKGEKRRAPLRGLEAAFLGFGGALIARIFISVVLGAGSDSHGAGLAAGWAFFLWPGAVDSVAALFGAGPVLTAPATLMVMASVIGGFAGMMDGVWRIHRWKRFGVLNFLSDMTWGLAGTTNSCLLHVVNFAWGAHDESKPHDTHYRPGGHRYRRGFALKPGFAFTQGSVMSNMGGHQPGSPLHKHEMIHVLQNRLFGPFFTLTYLGWMILMFLPSLTFGLVRRDVRLGDAILWWCYYNDPWEVWAYEAANPASRQHPTRSRLLWWSVPVAAVSAGLFTVPVLAGSVAVLTSVWF